METSLRIVLLLLAGAIILGILWDVFCSKRKENPATEEIDRSKTASKNKSRLDSSKPQRFNKNPFSNDHHFSFDAEQDKFDDVILINKGIRVSDDKDNQIQGSGTHSRGSDPNPKKASTYTHSISSYDEASAMAASSAYELVCPPRAEPTTKSQLERRRVYSSDLVILNIMARQPGIFLGKKLLEAFQEASLYFGEMNIFHRHENTDGVGRIIFSLASALEPGIFDLSKMDSFVTKGLTLFFQMERPNQSIAAFELMLRTAKQLSMRLDAEIKDDEHKFLTLPVIEKYRERVRLGYGLQANF